MKGCGKRDFSLICGEAGLYDGIHLCDECSQKEQKEKSK